MDQPIGPDNRLPQWLHALAEQERADWAGAGGAAVPTAQCLQVPRLRTALLHGEWSRKDRVHVNHCARCQAIVEQVRRALWHPSASQLFAHVQRLPLAEDEPSVEYHLATDRCARCTRLVALMGADRLLRKLAEQACEEGSAKRERLKHALESCFDAVVPTSQRRETAAPATERHVAFSDGQTQGMFYREAGKHWLHLARRHLPTNALWYIVLGDAHGKPIWQRLLMPHLGPGEQDEVKARLPRAPPVKATLVGFVVDLDLLPGRQAAALLRRSVAALRQEEPSLLPHWQAWARQALEQRDLDARVRAVLQDLVRKSEGR